MSRSQNKFTRPLKRFYWSKKVGIVGIIGINAVLCIWMLSNQESETVTQPHNHISSTQSFSKAIAPDGSSSTTPSPTPTSSSIQPIWLSPIPGTTQPGKALPYSRDITPPLGSDTLPKELSPSVSGANLPNRVPAPNDIMPPVGSNMLSKDFPPIPETTPSSRAYTTSSTTTKPYQFTPPNRSLTPTNTTTTVNRSIPNSSNNTKSDRFSVSNTFSSNPSSTPSPNKFSTTATTTPSRFTNPTPGTTISPSSRSNQFSTTTNTTTTPNSIPASSNSTTPDSFTNADRIPNISNSTLNSRRLSTISNTALKRSTRITDSTTSSSRLLPSKVKPVRSPSIAANTTPTQAATTLEQAIDDANSVAVGLVVAKHERQLKPYTKTWRKAQDAISLLRRGKTRQEAARRAGISLSLLTQLIEWGQDRPSSIKLQRSHSIAANTTPTPAATTLEQATDDANAAAFGLAVAKRQKQLKPYTSTWRKAQDAISLLRQGKTRQEAARRAGISPSLLTQLIDWGQDRP